MSLHVTNSKRYSSPQDYLNIFIYNLIPKLFWTGMHFQLTWSLLIYVYDMYYKILSDYRLFGASRFVLHATPLSLIIFRIVRTVFNIVATEWYFLVVCRNFHYYCFVNGYRMRSSLHYPSSRPGHKSHHHSPPVIGTRRAHKYARTQTHTYIYIYWTSRWHILCKRCLNVEWDRLQRYRIISFALCLL